MYVCSVIANCAPVPWSGEALLKWVGFSGGYGDVVGSAVVLVWSRRGKSEGGQGINDSEMCFNGPSTHTQDRS